MEYSFEKKDSHSSIELTNDWRLIREDIIRREWLKNAEKKTVKSEMNAFRPADYSVAVKVKEDITQIRLDTCRTWSSHPAFMKQEGQLALERVLVSWVAHNPKDIGYCQSMNFLGALILVVCQGNEDESITVFINLMEKTSFGEYFKRESKFSYLKADVKSLEKLLIGKDPELSKHLKSIDFELTNISNWFLTCFFSRYPTKKVIRILDQVIKSGNRARDLLVQHGLQSLIEDREEILKCKDLETMFQFLKGKKIENDFLHQNNENTLSN